MWHISLLFVAEFLCQQDEILVLLIRNTFGTLPDENLPETRRSVFQKVTTKFDERLFSDNFSSRVFFATLPDS